jgi:hypothetical protein
MLELLNSLRESFTILANQAGAFFPSVCQKATNSPYVWLTEILISLRIGSASRSDAFGSAGDACQI